MAEMERIKNLLELPDKEQIYTLMGFFHRGYIHTFRGLYQVSMYQKLQKECGTKWGFFNVMWNKNVGRWIAFQFVEY